MAADDADPLSFRPVLYMPEQRSAVRVYDEGGRSEILSVAALRRAKTEIAAWPGYTPTPLWSLDTLARRAGVGAILYKDESERFGLGSFKALGGAYAVMRLLQIVINQRTGEHATASAIAGGHYADICGDITVTCATDGNHGRSVAWGARNFGCKCFIYVHAMVSQNRCNAIAAYGAEVQRVSGNYDDAVRRAAEEAAANGWNVVSDTSYPGYTDVPRDVMQGYGVMIDEVLDQLPAMKQPTHVFVQGGVGGLAAAICATFWERLGAKRPLMAIVEPAQAACLFASAVQGEPAVVHGDLDTIMAGLACGEVSLLAWEILKDGADAFLTIEDAAAAEAMRQLARPNGSDRPIVAGESAVAGLAGVLQAAANHDTRQQLRLNTESVVLVIGSEGATDADLYAQIVGMGSAEIGQVAVDA